MQLTKKKLEQKSLDGSAFARLYIYDLHMLFEHMTSRLILTQDSWAMEQER